MLRRPAPSPWPRLRDSWWVFALALTAVGLFAVGFLVRLRCTIGSCVAPPLGRLLDLDAVGGLPRLFTTGLFVALCLVALAARRATTGAVALWWTAIALVGAGLALAKLVSVHAALKSGLSPLVTLLFGMAVTVPALIGLWVLGRRWGVRGARPVVLALAVYAGTALGLDLVTSGVALVQASVGPLTVAGAAFVEELGEALAALLLLVVVRWQLPARTDAP
ncbi:hypothetical protein [Blastococcus sp. SYSU D00820]